MWSKFIFDGGIIYFVVDNLEIGVEIRKVDSQGRLILPSDWRDVEISGGREVYVIKRRGYLKILPKRKIDLTEFFDKADLGVDAIGRWKEFEKKFLEGRK